jgi:two-component system NtrC family sensor kinase
LSARLLLSLLGTVGVALAVYAVISFRSAEEGFNDFVLTDGERCSTLIRKATQDAMLLNRKGDVQTTLERMAQASTVTAIRIYNPGGTVVLSSHQEEIGRMAERTAEPCASCHQRAGPLPAATVARSDRTTGVGVLRHLSVIPNEAACASSACHPPPARQSVLGILDVELSAEPLQRTLRAARSRTLWTMASLILVSGVISAGFIHRVVHRPVVRLQAGTQRIARGDLETRIEVTGRHELAQLAAAFNAMADDLRAARQEATDWSRRLEEKVVAKTGELQRAQRQVLHMEKMASLGKLAATVAHELNNPLSSILTYARLVERELEDQPVDSAVRAELGEYLRLVQQECSRCGGIVQNLLLFSRRGGGAAMAPVDVNQVVERSLMLTRHHLVMQRIELRRESLLADPLVVANPGELEQALVALIVNAVEAMSGPGSEGGELLVRASGDAAEVRIDIGDTGVGIHPDVLPHIFEPFFSTKERESGVGLGLAVVYGIAQRHGGAVEVESALGQGSVFHLRLPRRPPTAAGEGPPPA